MTGDRDADRLYGVLVQYGGTMTPASSIRRWDTTAERARWRRASSCWRLVDWSRGSSGGPEAAQRSGSRSSTS